jgi:hypothetical protein
MRKILRAVVATFKVCLWTAKGLLTLVALAALLLWPVSRGRLLFVEAQRSSFSGGLDRLTMQVGSWDGRIFFARDRLSLRKDSDGSALPEGGWIWRAGAQPMAGKEGVEFSAWGPFQWEVTGGEYGRSVHHHRYVSAPSWLVGAVAIAWPLMSIGLVIRRRIKRRRRESPAA